MMDGISADDIRGLEYISEDLAGVIFDDTVLERLVALGLSQPDGSRWILTDKGREVLARAATAS